MTNIDQPYSDKDFNAITAAFERGPTFDCRKFRNSIESCAWVYVEGDKVQKKSPTPSARVKWLRSLGDKAATFSKELLKARDDPYMVHLLDETGLAIHQGGSFVSNLDQGAEVTVEVGLVTRLLAQLDEFEKLTRRAEQRARPNSKGGNRADAVLYELILSLREIYEKAAAQPRQLSGREVDSETESESNEFLRFLRVAVRPLGIKQSDAALRELYRRATQAVTGGL